MRKAIKPDEAAALVTDGAVLMIGGFMGVGTPERVVDALVAQGKGGFTVIAKVVVSHIGTNPGPGVSVDEFVAATEAQLLVPDVVPEMPLAA
jgi:acyl CoA:acetate/3-ketoacid CoA transferase alpha subunit